MLKFFTDLDRLRWGQRYISCKDKKVFQGSTGERELGWKWGYSDTDQTTVETSNLDGKDLEVDLPEYVIHKKPQTETSESYY